jgi:hypothetical protein
MSRPAPLLGVLLIALAGCLPFETNPAGEFAQVPSNPFPPPAPPVTRARMNAPAASQDVAMRVEVVGRKLLTDDSQAGIRPVFATIGLPQPEIFHVNSNLVYITEGLVNQCKSEGQIAAVLASEVARIVAERESVARREVREPERRPPPALSVGGGGNAYAADPIRHVELARFEQQNPKTPRRLPPPDPHKLAVALLEKAGYQKADLDAVTPILNAAQRNDAIERQFKGLPVQGSWRP